MDKFLYGEEETNPLNRKYYRKLKVRATTHFFLNVLFVQQNMYASRKGMAEAGGGRARKPSQILADQKTAAALLLAIPDFQTFRHP